MPLPTQPLTRTTQYARAILRASFAGLGMGTRQFLGQFSRGLGLVSWSAQKSIEDLDLDIVPSAQSSTAALAAWAFLLGLPNGAGGYGPLVPVGAAGGIGNLTGVKGMTFPAYPDTHAIATAPDGQTQIYLTAPVTIAGSPPGTGSVPGIFAALTPGSIGDIAAGSQMTWANAPAGADPTFTLTTGLGGGLDTETNAQVFLRILQRLQNPPRGGTAGDYRIWAQLIATIYGVYVYGRRQGTGTVDVVVTLNASGVGRAALTALGLTIPSVQSVQAMIDSLRPVACDGVNVMVPFTAVSGHLVRVRVSPSGLNNAFDWGSDQSWTGTPFSVDLFTPGTPATLRLNGIAPTTLKNAIDAYINGTGPQPRLQVLSTGSVINPLVGTSKTVTWSDAGGKTTITLDTLPANFVAPTNGDTVYPGGPVVAPIAQAELALVDGLGPSRVSGYGDPFSIWNDTLAINQVARVAEDAVDASGNTLVSEVLAGGATIDGSSASDLEAADATPSQAPEILYASHIAVTP